MTFPIMPMDEWISSLVDWLVTTFAGFFDGISLAIGTVISGLEDFLLWVPWWVIIPAFSLLAWRLAKWRIAIFVVLGLYFIGTLGLWERAMETLSLVSVAVLISIVFAIPLGIWAARNDTVDKVIRPILDTMQTMPSFVYLIPAIMFFGIGNVPGVVATVIFAVPPGVRLTNLGIRGVSADVVEAATAFGTTPWQLLVKVQLPLAMPTVLAGINQMIMLALSMVVIGAMIGAGGLGHTVYWGISRVDVGRGFIGGIAIVIIAIILDRITTAIAKPKYLQTRSK